MKKIICFVLCAAMMLSIVLVNSTAASASNFQFFDTVYQYDRVQIKMPDGTSIEGKVSSWRDYENSDMLQVKVNGKTYLTHSMNIVLIDE